MKIVFFGTPEYVVPLAEKLYKKYHTTREKGVVAVVTQPPKPVGRDQHIEYSALDDWAHKRGITVLHDFENIPQADLGIVAAYGRIIPQSVIDHFPNGILNVHPSLLPKYRGASPIQAAIANGETATGVTIIKMDEKMDHGNIVSSFEEEILDTDTNESLRKKLFGRTADFLVELIPNYINGKIRLKPQNHSDATFTKILKKEDGFIHADKIKAAVVKHDAAAITEIDRKFRAYHPWPGIYTIINAKGEDKRLKILDLWLDGSELTIKKIQLEGKKTVNWEEFKKGYPDQPFK